jgi:lipopolysaccharide biosynthesis protein
MYKISVLTHIYYENSYTILKDNLFNLQKYNTCYLFSISLDCLGKEDLINKIQNDFPNALILETPNIGKDIGGKLALIDLLLRLNLNPDYTILLHDKLSPQALNGSEWRDKLLKIIKKENIEIILDILKNDQSIGVVANKDCIFSEYSAQTTSFSTVNNNLLKEYLITYNISPANYHFVAGTMFWCRGKIIEDFFRKHPPLEIRKNLEQGNVLDNIKGTHTHTIERLFGLIAGSYGYTIKGI